MYMKGALHREIAFSLLAMAVLACNLQSAPTAAVQPETPTALPTAVGLASSTAEPPAVLPTLTSTTPPTATSTLGPPPVVTVSAVGGRLNVRRGPGPDYDTVGAFLDTQSATATARNEDGTWLLINAPHAAKPLGWIIVTTKYTSVNGNITGLPVMTVSAAVPAYIRNCTAHEMLVNPIGVTLLDRGNSPENQLQFFPGEYTVVDLTTETEVASITVFEGKTVDIKTDSSGKNYSCP